MSAYSIEEMLLEGQMEVKELFEFVKNNAEVMDAYSMEQCIFSRILGIGLSAHPFQGSTSICFFLRVI